MLKKAQSTVEYIILVAAVIAVVIVFLGPGGNFSLKFTESLNHMSEAMFNMANRVQQ